MIKREAGKYILYTSRVFGCHDTKAGAIKQEQAVKAGAIKLKQAVEAAEKAAKMRKVAEKMAERAWRSQYS